MISLSTYLAIWGATIFCAVTALICAVVLTIKFKKLTRLVRGYCESMALMSAQRGVAPPAAVLIRKWRAEYKKAESGSVRKQLYKDKLMEYHLLNGD